MTVEANKAVVRELYRLMNERAFDEMWELFTPDARWGRGRHDTTDAPGIDRMREVMVDPMPVFASGGIEFTVHSLTAEGDRVAAEVESHAPLVTAPSTTTTTTCSSSFRAVASPRSRSTPTPPTPATCSTPCADVRAGRGRTIDGVVMHALAIDVTSNLYVLPAFGAGIISFLSPCVLPIVPGYLSLVTGLSVGELQERPQPHYLKRIAMNTGLFVLGFTLVFVLLGLITTAAGNALFRNQETLTRISGGLVLLMAAYLAGSQLLTTPRMYQEFRFHPHLERFGPVAAPVAGAAFGLGWTPCIGPVLGARARVRRDGERPRTIDGPARRVLARARRVVPRRRPRHGEAHATRSSWFKRHSRAITLVSAAILAVFGVILLTDSLPEVTARLSDVLRDIGLGLPRRDRLTRHSLVLASETRDITRF